MDGFLKKESVPFELWTRRIAINHIIDEFRKNSKHREHIDYRDLAEDEFLHPAFDPAVEKEKLEEIMQAVNQLSVMNRAVFNLFVVDGYGHDEIGKMLKISSGTSKAHLHNAKKRLKDLLQQDMKKKVPMNNSVLQ